MGKTGSYDEAGPLTGSEETTIKTPDGTRRVSLDRVVAELSDDGPQGEALVRPSNWDTWVEKKNAARDTPVNIFWIGDSVAAGSTAGNIREARPFPWGVQDFLQRYIQADSGAGYVPASPDAVGPKADTTDGTHSSQDFTYKAVVLDGTEHVTHTFEKIDGVAVIYKTQGTGGDIRVRDGGPAGTILATIDADAATSYSNIWESDALDAEEHTIRVENVSGTNVVAGMFGFLGNREAGFRVWPCVRSGISNSSTVDNDSGFADELFDAVNPDMVIYGTGFNPSDQTAADYETTMRAQIEKYQGLAPDAVHVILAPYYLPTQGTRWDEAKVAKAYSLADELDLGVIDQANGVPDISVDESDLLIDSTHANAAGSKRLAAHAAAYLTGDSIGTLLSVADTGWTRKNNVVRNHSALEVVSTLGLFGDADDPFGQVYLVSAAIAQLVYGVNEAGIAYGGDGSAFPTTFLRLTELTNRTVSPIYGDGSDGALVNSGTLNMARDMQWTDVSGTGTINTNGYRPMIRGELSGSVSFADNGANASGATQGAGVTGWYSSPAGGAGGTGAGTAAEATSGNRCIGASGGTGGAGSGGAGGGAGYSSVLAVNFGVSITHITSLSPLMLWGGRVIPDNASPRRICGGSGGGGGGGDGASGGGGGAGGGIVAVFAYDSRNWTGGLSATGGNGGNGGGTNCGGGGGGGGGLVAIVSSLGLPTAPGARTVTGGTGGAKTGTGVAGNNGSNGTALALLV